MNCTTPLLRFKVRDETGAEFYTLQRQPGQAVIDTETLHTYAEAEARIAPPLLDALRTAETALEAAIDTILKQDLSNHTSATAQAKALVDVRRALSQEPPANIPRKELAYMSGDGGKWTAWLLDEHLPHHVLASATASNPSEAIAQAQQQLKTRK